MSYSFIPIVIGVAAASYYIESVKKKSKQKNNKIEIPKNTFKLVEKDDIKDIKEKNK